ncbi:MAG: glutamate 5-kinase [Deltaproteobacteria bacterium]|nr:glutamate 5-kinase [Deltaproteobacteria bacterium]
MKKTPKRAPNAPDRNGNARRDLERHARSGQIVIKIGSGVITDAQGRIEPRTIRRIADEIAPIIGVRRWPVIVSSGAIAAGMGILGLKSRPKSMPGLQAAAAVGQSKLVETWSAAFRKYDVPVAQVLLTHADLANRKRFLNARRALGEIARRRAVAIINENDTVSFEEIAFGDNDELAAQVSNVVDARLLVMLSVAGGVEDEERNRIREVSAKDPLLDRVARAGSSKYGSGGMVSKLRAARTAATRGAFVAIISGKTPGTLEALLGGQDVGTLIVPDLDGAQLKSRDHWIAHTLRPSGTVFVDQGAVDALCQRGKSLLASGVRRVEGEFSEGDCVDIALDGAKDEATGTFARGLTRYSREDIEQIRGHSSRDIDRVLGFHSGDAVVHRDDLVILSRG